MNGERKRIELQAHDPDKVLVLDDLGHDSCRLMVRNSGFSCDRRFYFDDLSRWIDALDRMNRVLEGEAVLKAQFEDDYLHWRVNHQGHVFVDGQISKPGTHSFRFEFRTDQTCLGPLAAAAKEAFREMKS